MSLEEFFLILDRRNVPYVVLRWFDQLPHVDPGEDVDILVADEHLEFVHTLLLTRPLRRDSQAFDVYSVSGLPGADFGGVPYYPPRFARAVLADAVRFRDLYRVPSLEHHFQSLAYHALYHKGYSSGLRTGTGHDDDRPASDHDYQAVLAGLAEQLGTPMVPTLDNLDLVLAGQGLRPPMDTLERLTPENAWIHDRFFTQLPDIDAAWRGLAVFVLRERAQDQVDLVQEELGRHGFELLEVVRLDPAQQDAASHHIRGGNWERGPWPVSGGGPGAYVIAYDVAPRFEPADGGPESNLRIPEAKAEVRDRLLHDVDPLSQYNPLHSSDNPRQALEYLDLLADTELMARVGGRARALVDACAVPFPLLRYLAPGAPARRARVALVDHPVHGPSVCKIYRPGAHRFFERELRARKELGDLPEVPDLLDHGDNWLLTPLYQDDRRQVLRRLPFAEAFDNEVQFRPEATRAMAGFVRALHERGLFILDLSSENVITDPVAGLKVLDLEFLQEYAGHPPTLSGCYSVRGVPPQDRGSYDQPHGVPLAKGGGSSVFHPAVAGLPFRALLRHQRPADVVRRPVTQLTWYLYLGVTRGYRTARSSLGGSRWGRRSRRLFAMATDRRRRPA